MSDRVTRRKLAVFGVVSVLAVGYGTIELFDAPRLLRDQVEVSALFADPEGLAPRAQVDLMGVRVGEVREIVPGPGAVSTVVLELEPGAAVPADVQAEVASKSAIGEQFVQLTPRSEGGPPLVDGDVLDLARTTSPPDLARLLASTESLVGSVPLDAVRTTLEEGSLAVGSSSPELRRILDDLDTLSASALAGVDDLTTLIDDAQTVLATQVDLAPATRAALGDLAPLLRELRRLDPTFDQVFVRGVRAGTEVTGLLRDNQDALPVLLNHLQTLTDLGDDNLPGIRKALVVFPWALEYNSQALRFCDDIDPVTGRAEPGSCHYDSQGLPVWSAHIANIVGLRGGATAQPCTRGYEGTTRFRPDGQRLDGDGPPELPDQPPNYDAGCTAPPSDPTTPNVRGFQNIPVPGRGIGPARSSAVAPRVAPGWGRAVLNPETGTVVTPDGLSFRLPALAEPVPDSADLGWLLTRTLVG